MEKIERESFIVYRSYWEGLKRMPAEVQLELYNAIMEYGFTGQVPELSSTAEGIFILMKPNVDTSIARYANGRKGGKATAKKKKKADKDVGNAVPQEQEQEQEESSSSPSTPSSPSQEESPTTDDFAFTPASSPSPSEEGRGEAPGASPITPDDEKLYHQLLYNSTQWQQTIMSEVGKDPKQFPHYLGKFKENNFIIGKVSHKDLSHLQTRFTKWLRVEVERETTARTSPTPSAKEALRRRNEAIEEEERRKRHEENERSKKTAVTYEEYLKLKEKKQQQQ